MLLSLLFTIHYNINSTIACPPSGGYTPDITMKPKLLPLYEMITSPRSNSWTGRDEGVRSHKVTLTIYMP